MSHRQTGPPPPPPKHQSPKPSSNNHHHHGKSRAGPSNGGPNTTTTGGSPIISSPTNKQNARIAVAALPSSSSSSSSSATSGPSTAGGKKSPLLSSLAHNKASTSTANYKEMAAAKALHSPVGVVGDENNVVLDDVLDSERGEYLLKDETTTSPDQFEVLFGSTDSEDDQTSSISMLPDNVLENVFTFLELPDIVAAGCTCTLWNRVISDENGDVWRSLCLRRMDRETLNSEMLAMCPSYKTKLRAFYHAWNPLDCSRNIYVKPNGFTIHRNPVAQSTDGARGKIGFAHGRHAWEVKWEGPLGTVAVLGVATHDADLRMQGYIALLGKDERSWGWNLVENVLLHNGDSQGNYPLVNNAPRYQVGEKIRVILDCEDNTLSFEKNDEFLGVAFRGLPQHELLFPAVSAVYGNSEISMIYLGPPLDG